MIVKKLLVSLLLVALFSSCDPNAGNQTGNANRYNNANTGGSGSAGGSGSGSVNNNAGAPGTPTDAPLDGGLGILLLVGAAYGAKRIRGAKGAGREK